MGLLLTADIHLTDNPRDAYRWGLFTWLGEQHATHIAILGDLTDAKDRHSAALVNRLVRAVRDLADHCEQIIILKGNHDYIDPACPFFGFLRAIDGVSVVAIKPRAFTVDGREVLAIPNGMVEGEPGDLVGAWNDYDLVLTHETYDGCLTENGTELRGLPPSIFKGFAGKVWSGDIHVPQKVGKTIEYVGAPYRVRFGDQFEPRCVLIDKAGKATDLPFPCPSKHTITISTAADLDKALRGIYRGDQVKVRVLLKRSEYADWPKLKASIKEAAASAGFELYGPELLPLKQQVPRPDEADKVTGRRTPIEVVKDYAKTKRMTKETEAAGLALLKEVL